MITVTPVNPQGILEVRIAGTLSADDYRDTLTPALDEAIGEHDRIRLLLRVGADFKGFTARAALADAKLGLRHWTGFERIAVVTDTDWIENMVQVLGFAMPGAVETFELDELDEARRWLTESLGSLQMQELGDGILELRLLGKLDSAAYARAEDNLDAFVRDHGRFKLLLDLREFDGWQGLAALGDHLKLVREHRHLPTRVAVVGDESWHKLARRLMRHFISAETRYFDDDITAARSWLA
jgi:hypothetical protein